MNYQFCEKCSEQVLPTMRVCPNCGNRSFSSSPPISMGQTPTQTAGQGAHQPTPASAVGSNTHGTNWTGVAPTKFVPASHFKRFVAAIVDALIVAVLSALPVGFAYGMVGASSGSMSPNALVTSTMMLAAIAVPYIYYTLLHASPNCATWGKQLMGLMVITVQGERLTKMQSFIRIMLKTLLPVAGLFLLVLSAAGMMHQYKSELQDSIMIAAGIGALFVYLAPFAMVFFNEGRQTLFDVICKTCVVNRTTI